MTIYREYCVSAYLASRAYTQSTVPTHSHDNRTHAHTHQANSHLSSVRWLRFSCSHSFVLYRNSDIFYLVPQSDDDWLANGIKKISSAQEKKVNFVLFFKKSHQSILHQKGIHYSVRMIWCDGFVESLNRSVKVDARKQLYDFLVLWISPIAVHESAQHTCNPKLTSTFINLRLKIFGVSGRSPRIEFRIRWNWSNWWKKGKFWDKNRNWNEIGRWFHFGLWVRAIYSIRVSVCVCTYRGLYQSHWMRIEKTD